MQRNAWKFFFLLFFSTNVFAEDWKPISDGIKIKILSQDSARSRIIAFKINPKLYNFSVAMGKPVASVGELAKQSQALIAINGGFFSADLKPLGLRINNYQVLSPFKKINWWGVFYIENNKPHLKTSQSFTLSSQIAFAVQAGPRLLIHNMIPRFKPDTAERSAIGISNDQQVIIAITQSNELSLTQWAEILKTELDCTEALNLDGGSSSQLYTDLPETQIYVPNFSRVTDAVIVTDH